MPIAQVDVAEIALIAQVPQRDACPVLTVQLLLGHSEEDTDLRPGQPCLPSRQHGVVEPYTSASQVFPRGNQFTLTGTAPQVGEHRIAFIAIARLTFVDAALQVREGSPAQRRQFLVGRPPRVAASQWGLPAAVVNS